MISAAVWLMLSGMLASLRISGAGGSFPKPLSAQEEQKPSASGKTSGDTGRHPRRGRRCPLHGGAAPRAAEQTAPPLCPTDTKSRSPSPKKS